MACEQQKTQHLTDWDYLAVLTSRLPYSPYTIIAPTVYIIEKGNENEKRADISQTAG